MPLNLSTARWLANDVLRPGHFFSTLPLAWTHNEAETPRWEVFQGRLLDPAHTWQEATFETWNVHEALATGLSPEPILSLKLDAARGVLHVVRGVENYVHEAYSEGNVIQTREARRWVRELIASFDLSRFDESPELRDEVTAALSRAVTGTRLPLTPIEAPLPAFTFGKLFYFPEPTNLDAMLTHPDQLRNWLGPATGCGQTSRLIEFVIRVAPAGSAWWAMFLAADWVLDRSAVSALLPMWKVMFSDVSLSPWTDFVEKVLHGLDLYAGMQIFGPAASLDFESHLLRLIGRHLTAYDLVTFHHRGANYPDALLLDAVLNDYLARLEQHPDLFAGEEGRIRRRALRQAYLLRRHYENHPVPDMPTSPGEHMRVLPEGYPRVPEEQILQPATRRRRLYENDPLLARLSPAALAVLRQSVADLHHPDERQELGAAVFLDRPFGGAKAPVEPDATPLLASLAYSRSIASGRLRSLLRDLSLPESDIPDLNLPGLTLDRIGPPVRQGTVSLNDAARAGPDFVYRRTLSGSVRALQDLFDLTEVADVLSGQVLIARAPDGPGLWVYDESLTPRLLIEPRLERGYASRRGVEFPAAGLRVTRMASRDTGSR